MKRYMTIVAISALALGGPAMAGIHYPSMPSYDIAAACEDEQGDYLCVAGEYAGRSIVSREWLDTEPAVRAECIAINRWNSYLLLDSCISSHKLDKDVMGH